MVVLLGLVLRLLGVEGARTASDRTRQCVKMTVALIALDIVDQVVDARGSVDREGDVA